jgi:galactoside O-acetyltransferase
MDFCGLAPGVLIFSGSDDYSGKKLTNPTVLAQKYLKKTIKRSDIGGTFGKVILCKHVIIGANSVILPNLTIKEGSCVGALSLVTRRLASWGVYFGIPVKRLKDRSKNLLKLEKIYKK